MDDITANVKDVTTTLGGLITAVVAFMKIFGLELDPSVLAKVNLEGIALAIVGFLMVFKVGGKKTS